MRQLLQRGINLIVGDTWPKRRRVVYATLVFCSVVIMGALGAAIAEKNMSAVLNIAENAFFLGGSVIFAYVFGSIWDDVDKRRHLAKQDEVAPPATPPSGGAE